MTDCTAPRHAEEPVDARPHAYLCYPCERGFSRDLRRLPGLHADLDQLHHATRAAHGRGTGDGLPFNSPASDCASDIRRHLAQIVREVTADREGVPWGFGDGPRPLPIDDNLPAMCGYVHGAVRWLVFRDWAGMVAGIVARDASRARSLLDPWVTKRFELPGADGICLKCGEGRMEATIYASDGDRRRPVLACALCGESLAPESWLRYGEKVIARRSAGAA